MFFNIGRECFRCILVLNVLKQCTFSEDKVFTFLIEYIFFLSKSNANNEKQKMNIFQYFFFIFVHLEL